MKCKVEPEKEVCEVCMSLSNSGFIYTSDCSTCSCNTDEYELLRVGSDIIFGDYAMVLKDGRIHKVDLDRVYDVK